MEGHLARWLIYLMHLTIISKNKSTSQLEVIFDVAIWDENNPDPGKQTSQLQLVEDVAIWIQLVEEAKHQSTSSFLLFFNRLFFVTLLSNYSLLIISKGFFLCTYICVIVY